MIPPPPAVAHVLAALLAQMIEAAGVEETAGVFLAAVPLATEGARDYLKERWLRPLVTGWDAAEMIGNLAAADFEEIFGAAIARIIRERGTSEGGALVREALEGAIKADHFGRAHFDTGRD